MMKDEFQKRTDRRGRARINGLNGLGGHYDFAVQVPKRRRAGLAAAIQDASDYEP